MTGLKNRKNWCHFGFCTWHWSVLVKMKVTQSQVYRCTQATWLLQILSSTTWCEACRNMKVEICMIGTKLLKLVEVWDVHMSSSNMILLIWYTEGFHNGNGLIYFSLTFMLWLTVPSFTSVSLWALAYFLHYILALLCSFIATTVTLCRMKQKKVAVILMICKRQQMCVVSTKRMLTTFFCAVVRDCGWPSML